MFQLFQPPQLLTTPLILIRKRYPRKNDYISLMKLRKKQLVLITLS